MALRTAVIGFGRIAGLNAADSQLAREYEFSTHAQVLREHPAFDWGAVVDTSEQALSEARKTWGIRQTYANVETMLRQYAPEVVSICTPPYAHLDIIQSLGGVKAVMLEKPIGADRHQILQIAEFCRKCRFPTQVNFWRRGDETLRCLVTGGIKERIGEVQAAFGLYGNGLRNNGVHLLDFLRMQLGEIDWVQAIGDPTPAGPIEADVQFPFAVGMKDGPLVQFQPVDFRHYRENAIELWGTEGRISFLSDFRQILSAAKAKHNCFRGCFEIQSDRPEKLRSTHGRALYEMYANLADHLLHGVDLVCSIHDAVRSEHAVYALLESASAGGTRIVVAY